MLSGIVAESIGDGSRERAESEESELGNAAIVYDYDLQRKAVALFGERQDIGERKSYALKLFVLLACWMGFVAICFLLAGFGNGTHAAIYAGKIGFPFFYLSDTVLVALLAGATVNLIALFAIVAWYLFPKK